MAKSASTPSKKVKVGVLLSGCGVMDGSEIHEAVIALLSLDRAGATIVPLAPDKPQQDVVDHQAGSPVAGATRNVRSEAARIARGPVGDVAATKADDLDAVVLPGGYGAAKNLCTFASEGPGCRIDAGVEKLLRSLHAQKKPIGAICIAPAVVARALGSDAHPTVTIGTDRGTAAALEQMGARHEAHAVGEICVDETNRIVTTPAYMLASRISEAAAGIEKLCARVVEMARSGAAAAASRG